MYTVNNANKILVICNIYQDNLIWTICLLVTRESGSCRRSVREAVHNLSQQINVLESTVTGILHSRTLEVIGNLGTESPIVSQPRCLRKEGTFWLQQTHLMVRGNQ